MIAETMSNHERPSWIDVMARTHFGFSQFFNRNKHESRFLTFSKYLTVVSIYQIYLCMFYNNEQRNGSLTRELASIDFNDFKQISQNVLIGAVIVQPWSNIIFAPSLKVC